jgi:hypothetical protein
MQSCRLQSPKGNGKGLNVLSSLSLPMVRGTLEQKVLDAPMERDTGARRAKGLRRMEGILCGVMVICDVVVPEERELASRSSCSFEESRGSGMVLYNRSFQ